VDTGKSITFVVLSYNHEDYILEHLESIAHLIKKYRQEKKHDLVISDDASKDQTVMLVSRWLEHNQYLFCNIVTHYGSENLGTCKSYLRATGNIRTDYVKITGGDDLYSEEDIFSVVRHAGNADIIGSQPIVLINGVLHQCHKIGIAYAAATAVYRDAPFRDQLVGHGSIYTPGLIYTQQMVTDINVREFIAKFELVEDLPFWIAISDYHPTVSYYISTQHLVYYRRTPDSAYLIAGSRVYSDHLKCRLHLLQSEKRSLNRILIKNRIWLMRHCPPKVRKFLDFGRFVFMLKLLTHLHRAIINIKTLSFDIVDHTRHYNYIRKKSHRYNESAN